MDRARRRTFCAFACLTLLCSLFSAADISAQESSTTEIVLDPDSLKKSYEKIASELKEAVASGDLQKAEQSISEFKKLRNSAKAHVIMISWMGLKSDYSLGLHLEGYLRENNTVAKHEAFEIYEHLFFDPQEIDFERLESHRPFFLRKGSLWPISVTYPIFLFLILYLLPNHVGWLFRAAWPGATPPFNQISFAMLSFLILLFMLLSDLHVNVISALSNSSREASHLKNLHFQTLQIAQAEHSFWRSIWVTPDREKKFDENLLRLPLPENYKLAEPAQPSAHSEKTTAPRESTGSNHHPCSESLKELAQ